MKGRNGLIQLFLRIAKRVVDRRVNSNELHGQMYKNMLYK